MKVKEKYFTTLIKDIPSNISLLRKQFPGCTFKNGKWNNEYGTYILTDDTPGSGEFDKPIKSKQYKDYLWFPPKRFNVSQEWLTEQIKNKNSLKVKVPLDCGIELQILPATEEPRKVALSLLGDEEEEPVLVSEYGKEAYRIDDLLFRNEEVIIKECLKLIVLGISKSYNISIDLLNHCNLIGTGDIENLLYACLGYDENLKKKE